MKNKKKKVEIMVLFILTMITTIMDAQDITILEQGHGTWDHEAKTIAITDTVCNGFVTRSMNGITGPLSILGVRSGRDHSATKIKFVANKTLNLVLFVQGDAHASISINGISTIVEIPLNSNNQIEQRRALKLRWGNLGLERTFRLKKGDLVEATCATCASTFNCEGGFVINKIAPPVPVVEEDTSSIEEEVVAEDQEQKIEFDIYVELDEGSWPWWYYVLLCLFPFLGAIALAMVVHGPEDKRKSKEEKEKGKSFLSQTGGLPKVILIFLFLGLGTGNVIADTIPEIQFSHGFRKDKGQDTETTIPGYYKTRELSIEILPFADLSPQPIDSSGREQWLSIIRVQGTNPLTGLNTLPKNSSMVYQMFSGTSEQVTEAILKIPKGKWNIVWAGFEEGPGHGLLENGSVLFLNRECGSYYYANEYSEGVGWKKNEKGSATDKWYSMPVVSDKDDYEVILRVNGCAQGAHGAILWFCIVPDLPQPHGEKAKDYPADTAIIVGPDARGWQWAIEGDSIPRWQKNLALPAGKHDLVLHYQPLAGCSLTYHVTAHIQNKLPPFPWWLAVIITAIGAAIYLILFLLGQGKDKKINKNDKKKPLINSDKIDLFEG